MTNIFIRGKTNWNYFKVILSVIINPDIVFIIFSLGLLQMMSSFVYTGINFIVYYILFIDN